jgi:hypothetical protein
MLMPSHGGGPAGGGPTETPSYWNSGGYGDRQAAIVETSTATVGGGAISSLIDGSMADSYWINSGQTTREFKFDFGTAKVINGFRWVESTFAAMGTWVAEISNDDSSYTQIGSSFTLGHNNDVIATYLLANTTAARYLKLRQTGGTTSSAPYLREIEFSIATPGTDVVHDARESGDRTALITVTTTATLGGGAITALVNGPYVGDTSGSCFFNGGQSTREIKFDMAVAKTVTGFTWVQSVVASHGT